MLRFLRYLRIAFSATCLIACVLLIALWVRSYTVKDSFRRGNGGTLLNIQSHRGELGIGRWTFANPLPWRHSVEAH